MLRLRPAHERGHFDHGWLDTRHTFSFAEYTNPDWPSFHTLRVINEDRVAPGAGFGTHGHRDMEIVSYVLAGALQHRDSLGHGAVLRPGEFQRITAGRGIEHSEFNPSATEPVHFYQIWLYPRRKGLEPGYEQRAFDPTARVGIWQWVATSDGRAGSLTIQQDAAVALAEVEPGGSIDLPLNPGRHAWLQVLRGTVRLDDQVDLHAGDGVGFSHEAAGRLRGMTASEVMFFDLT